jgi:uncharacterized protein (TIGR03067 family)
MAKSFATLVVVALMSVATFAQVTGRSGGQTTPQAPAKPQAPVDKALAPMQGTWVVTEFNGEAPAAMLIAIKGDKYEVIVNDAVTERGTIKLDATKKPLAMDLMIQEGEDAGKLQVGILEVTGDTMKAKLAAPATTTRPTSFTAEEGFVMVSLTRRK